LKKNLKKQHIIGIDEVGRGPLAGPVAVCACVIDYRLNRKLIGIKDSKKLTAFSRDLWFLKMVEWQQAGLLSYKVVFQSSTKIDRRGIVPSISTALQKALASLQLDPRECRVLLDGGLKAPKEYQIQETIIKGDEKEPAIALASIAAKVTRDRLMIRLAKKYPGYGFELHKGYGTKHHLNAIKKQGLVPIHRRSFLRSLRTS
jgi:ribonuclease HII